MPLVIRFPGRVPVGRVSEAVTLRDLPATLLDLAALPGGSTFPGYSLRWAWQGGAPDSAAPRSPSPLRSDLGLYPEEVAGWAPGVVNWAPAWRGPMFSLVEDSLHYILNGDGVEELYDVLDDPLEASDLSGLPGASADLERMRAAAASVRSP